MLLFFHYAKHRIQHHVTHYNLQTVNINITWLNYTHYIMGFGSGYLRAQKKNMNMDIQWQLFSRDFCQNPFYQFCKIYITSTSVTYHHLNGIKFYENVQKLKIKSFLISIYVIINNHGHKSPQYERICLYVCNFYKYIWNDKMHIEKSVQLQLQTDIFVSEITIQRSTRKD